MSPYRVRATFQNGFTRDYPVPNTRRGVYALDGDPLDFALKSFSHSRLKKVELVDGSGPVRVVSFDGEVYP